MCRRVFFAICSTGNLAYPNVFFFEDQISDTGLIVFTEKHDTGSGLRVICRRVFSGVR